MARILSGPPPGGVYHPELGIEGTTVYPTPSLTVRCPACGQSTPTDTWDHSRSAPGSLPGWLVAITLRDGVATVLLVCSAECSAKLPRVPERVRKERVD